MSFGSKKNRFLTTSNRAAIKMQSSLPTLSLQRFYLSRTLQTPRQALRGQESAFPSRMWKLRRRQRQEGLLGARPHSPAGARLHLRAPGASGRGRIGWPDPAPLHAASPGPRPRRTHLSRPPSSHTPGGRARAAPPHRTSAQAAQVGAELHPRPASCMTQAGRRRAAGSARSIHHPARGRRLTGHVTRQSRARRAPGKKKKKQRCWGDLGR